MGPTSSDISGDQRRHTSQPISITHYRAEIDGLRALAVLAVLLFHAFPQTVRGGYYGVDVFFVISGFLITGIIDARLAAGNFSFSAFYGARIRRLFPALCLVLTAVLGYGCIALLPSELSRLGADTTAGASFVANLWLWHQADYFDRASSAKPLLHLWSLGVEEQFYAVWPLAMWLLVRTGRAKPSWLAALTAASFAAACLTHEGTARFYSPLARMWELWAGATLALGKPRLTAPDATAAAGLLAILTAIVLPDVLPGVTGSQAPLAVLGAVAVIAAGQKGALNRRLLASRPAVAIGLISYPLYLWHWPLLSYAYILRRGRAPAPFLAAMLLLASAALAAATYFYFERKLRFGRQPARTTRALVTAMALLGVAGAGIFASGGWPMRFNGGAGLDIAALNDAIGDGVFTPTPDMQVQRDKGFIDARIGRGRRRVLFIGDSLLFPYGPRVQALFSAGQLNVTALFLTGPSCLPVAGLERRLAFIDCTSMPQRLQRVLQAEPIDTIVIGGFWQGYPGDSPISRGGQTFPVGSAANVAAFWGNLQDLTQTLVHDGHHVAFILCSPNAPEFDPAAMVKRSLTGVTIAHGFGGGVAKRDIAAGCAASNGHLSAIASQYGATVLNPVADICGPGPDCPALFGSGIPKYADDKHLRPIFVRDHIHFFDQILDH